MSLLLFFVCCKKTLGMLGMPVQLVASVTHIYVIHGQEIILKELNPLYTVILYIYTHTHIHDYILNFTKYLLEDQIWQEAVFL